jgi:AAA15 family ATPase/GTPase
VYISNLYIDYASGITNYNVDLNLKEHPHLIITGFNGRGKTRTLKAVRTIIETITQRPIEEFDDQIEEHGDPIEELNDQICDPEELDDEYDSDSDSKELADEYDPDEQSNDIFGELKRFLIGPVRSSDQYKAYQSDGIRLSYCDSATLYEIELVCIPDSRSSVPQPKRIDLSQPLKDTNPGFLDYMLSLYESNEKDKNASMESKASYGEAIKNFKEVLNQIFCTDYLELNEDLLNFTYQIAVPDHQPFAINEMSSGHSSFINIYMELVMRSVLKTGAVSYDLPAIVLIDDLETHLHVSLQRWTLPLLTRLFPNAQFIVTTHSPLIMTSLDNATVFDLEQSHTLLEPVLQPYSAVIESYLDSKEHSEVLEIALQLYKNYFFKQSSLTPEQHTQFVRAQQLLKQMTPIDNNLYWDYKDFENHIKRIKRQGFL